MARQKLSSKFEGVIKVVIQTEVLLKGVKIVIAVVIWRKTMVFVFPSTLSLLALRQLLPWRKMLLLFTILYSRDF